MHRYIVENLVHIQNSYEIFEFFLIFCCGLEYMEFKLGVGIVRIASNAFPVLYFTKLTFLVECVLYCEAKGTGENVLLFLIVSFPSTRYYETKRNRKANFLFEFVLQFFVNCKTQYFLRFFIFILFFFCYSLHFPVLIIFVFLHQKYLCFFRIIFSYF